jgi:hypothetical protein
MSEDDNIPELNANCGAPGVVPLNGMTVAIFVKMLCVFVPVDEIFNVGATR